MSSGELQKKFEGISKYVPHDLFSPIALLETFPRHLPTSSQFVAQQKKPYR